MVDTTIYNMAAGNVDVQQFCAKTFAHKLKPSHEHARLEVASEILTVLSKAIDDCSLTSRLPNKWCVAASTATKIPKIVKSYAFHVTEVDVANNHALLPCIIGMTPPLLQK